ncbi:hypothetical protein QKW52_16635 [Bacillus sonorensis]|nr:hypothetical protein [Bacillus sonorensis]
MEQKRWAFLSRSFRGAAFAAGEHRFFQTDAADPYIRYVKEKFSEESGVFVGNGSSLFGREGYASLMGFR